MIPRGWLLLLLLGLAGGAGDAMAALEAEVTEIHLGESVFPVQLGQVRTTDTPVDTTHFTLTMPQEQASREALRRQVLNACGLWPMPDRGKLPVRLGEPRVFDGYSVASVALESVPGLHLCGNLWRPEPLGDTPRPAVLTPHGHWADGRFHHDESGSIPARCLTLARQGYVVLSYDMVGYGETGRRVGHAFGQGDHRAALWGVSLGGLQTWNSLCALDFLLSLPEVDAGRVGITGASGGGTQTFLLCAIDDRWAAAAPVNMVSSLYQGGCWCENPPLLRHGTHNLAITALGAPKPVLLVSCTGDWTRNTPTVEGPLLREHWTAMGAGDRLHWVQEDAGHNYNRASREHVYAFFGRHLLGVDDPERLREAPLEPPSREALQVWATEPPADEVDGPTLLERLIDQRRAAYRQALPTDAASLRRFDETYGEGLRLSLGGPLSRSETPSSGAEDTYVPEAVTPTLRVVWAGRHTGEAMLEALMDELCRISFVRPFYLSPVGGPWANHYLCYNPTQVQAQARDIALTLRSAGPGAVLVGTGVRGPVALLARTLVDWPVPCAVDLNGLDWSDDAVLAESLFSPNLRLAGDLTTAAMVGAEAPLLLHNVDERWDTAPLETAHRLTGAALVVAPEPWDESAVVRWLIDHAPEA